jgi:hypothetical protein
MMTLLLYEKLHDEGVECRRERHMTSKPGYDLHFHYLIAHASLGRLSAIAD